MIERLDSSKGSYGQSTSRVVDNPPDAADRAETGVRDQFPIDPAGVAHTCPSYPA
jgi:hypothetical protein